MIPLIVSFYTPEYREAAKRLTGSMDVLELEYDVRELPSLGKWRPNCCMKAQFVFDRLTEARRSILWVDADAEVLQKPVLFEDNTIEFAAWMGRERSRGHIRSGTLYFQNTTRCLRLVGKWNKLCKDQPGKMDQSLLHRAYFDMPEQERPTMTILPQGYCKIFDNRWFKHESKAEFVRHHQASRKLRRVVNAQKTQD
jgi:hypothetical protein